MNGEHRPKMIPSLRSPLGALRLVNLAEGISFLVLLGIAMPLKYLAHHALPVRICGMIHGILFVILVLRLFIDSGAGKITAKTAAIVFAASLIPLGSFFADRMLERRSAGA